jgi:uncharacterized protein DUF2271
MSAGAQAPRRGTIDVSFLYMPPQQVEPTYHTAIWLEDASGRMVKTLFVSHDLSATGYKTGEACPDWIRQAHWESAAPATVDAVTGPTPHVGLGGLQFDVDALAIPAGVYEFRFQVHITETFNVLYRGSLTIGPGPSEADLRVVYSAAKPAGAPEFVRDVRARFVPPAT